MSSGEQPESGVLPSLLGLDAGTLRKREQEKRASVLDQVRKIFQEQRESIYRYLRALGAPETDAEEFTQEAFLRLLRYLKSGHRVDHSRAWLLRVAHNLWREEGRTRSRRRLLDMGTALESAQLPDPQPNPEALLADSEREARLQEAIAQLTDLQRSALLLRSEGLHYREIAAVLDVSSSTVAAAVRRAVEKLGRLANA